MNEERLSRRSFITLTFGWLGFLGSLGAFFTSSVRFFFPNVLFEPSRKYKIGLPEDYADGAILFLDEIKTFLIRKDNTFRALSAVCPHLGCTVNRVAGATPYKCPCHGSFFNEDGKVMSGPSPKPLPWLAVSKAKDGRLVIETDRIVDPQTSFQA